MNGAYRPGTIWSVSRSSPKTHARATSPPGPCRRPTARSLRDGPSRARATDRRSAPTPLRGRPQPPLDRGARRGAALEPHARRDPPAGRDRGGRRHVAGPAVRARAEEHDVDWDADRLAHVGYLVHARRDRDLRLERREIDVDAPG